MRIRAFVLTLFVVAMVFAPPALAGHVRAGHRSDSSLSDQGTWLVQQLDRYAGSYYARVAGRDYGLAPRVNGHDEFEAQWSRDMLAALHGLPVRVLRRPFATPGFRRLPAKHAGVNVIVVVPGSKHSDQAIVIGSHPDGEPFSKGSAYDDASGCMIMLGAAQTLGAIWRAHGLPALTVEFVLFDAEEQGLIGSTDFGFALRRHALQPRPVFMIDEEQSGVGYPVRPFGLLSEKLLPMYAITTGGAQPGWSRLFGPWLRADQSALKVALDRLDTARSQVFGQLHDVYGSIPYRGGTAPAFTSGDEGSVQIGPSPICCSDNAPFEALGLPTVTFAGDADYYGSHGVTYSFPFDQPQDTPQALACDTEGSPQPGPALAAALELPTALTVAVVQDYAPTTSSTAGLAVFSEVPGAGARLTFDAAGQSDVRWTFGDGGTAQGVLVGHTYRHAGTFHVTVRARSAGATLSQTYSLTVASKQAVFKSPLHVAPPPRIRWHPAELQHISGCH